MQLPPGVRPRQTEPMLGEAHQQHAKAQGCCHRLRQGPLCKADPMHSLMEASLRSRVLGLAEQGAAGPHLTSITHAVEK